jgi:phosphatidylethanolamine-binding protein (PEBP) family uncharacterized protein
MLRCGANGGMSHSYLDVEPGADRSQLIDAMTGHVLAKGELVGVYEAPSP